MAVSAALVDKIFFDRHFFSLVSVLVISNKKFKVVVIFFFPAYSLKYNFNIVPGKILKPVFNLFVVHETFILVLILAEESWKFCFSFYLFKSSAEILYLWNYLVNILFYNLKFFHHQIFSIFFILQAISLLEAFTKSYRACSLFLRVFCNNWLARARL